MSQSFSVTRARCADLSSHDLLEQIRAHTTSDVEADSILRSLERFGEDGSIRFYEVIPGPARKTRHTSSVRTWTVRAVR